MGHFAILSCNVGILIGSLLRASRDSNFNLLPEQTFFHIGILWVDWDGKQHYLCFKEGKSNFPLVVGSNNCSFLESFQLKVLASSDSWQSSDSVKSVLVRVLISRRSVSCAQFLVVVAVSFENFSEEMVSHFLWLSGALACKSQNHKELRFGKFLASAAVHVNHCLRSPQLYILVRDPDLVFWDTFENSNRFLHSL